MEKDSRWDFGVETVEVVVLGKRIRIRSDGDDDYIREVAEYVNEKMDEVLKASQTTTTLNVAILAAMNIADDYFRVQGKSRAMTHEISEKVDRIIDYIDEKIGELE